MLGSLDDADGKNPLTKKGSGCDGRRTSQLHQKGANNPRTLEMGALRTGMNHDPATALGLGVFYWQFRPIRRVRFVYI